MCNHVYNSSNQVYFRRLTLTNQWYLASFRVRFTSNTTSLIIIMHDWLINLDWMCVGRLVNTRLFFGGDLHLQTHCCFPYVHDVYAEDRVGMTKDEETAM